MISGRIGSRFERHMPAYVNCLLSDRRRRWFERRLAGSDVRRSELRSYRRMLDLLLAAPVRYPDPDAWRGFGSRVRAQIEREAGAVRRSPETSELPIRRPLLVRQTVWGAAFGLIIGCAIGLGFWRVASRPALDSIDAALSRSTSASARDPLQRGEPFAEAFAVDEGTMPLIELLFEDSTMVSSAIVGSASGTATGWRHFVGDEVVPSLGTPIDLYHDGTVFPDGGAAVLVRR